MGLALCLEETRKGGAYYAELWKALGLSGLPLLATLRAPSGPIDRMAAGFHSVGEREDCYPNVPGLFVSRQQAVLNQFIEQDILTVFVYDFSESRAIEEFEWFRARLAHILGHELKSTQAEAQQRCLFINRAVERESNNGIDPAVQRLMGIACSTNTPSAPWEGRKSVVKHFCFQYVRLCHFRVVVGCKVGAEREDESHVLSQFVNPTRVSEPNRLEYIPGQLTRVAGALVESKKQRLNMKFHPTLPVSVASSRD
jgi:hypothetical protein